jgi:hypothetical protein
MRNWLPTFPLLNRPLPETGPVPEDYLDWSVPELYAGRRFAQAAATATPAPVGAGAESATTPSLPGWLADSQWQAMPETTPWPEPPMMPRSVVGEDRRERGTIRLGRSMPLGSQRGPRFFNEPPPDYPSHLRPVPRALEWEQVVPGPTPWSPLAEPRRATDWGRAQTGIECRRTEDGGHHDCITPGGRRFTVPTNEAFPDYIGPGQPNYHSYNIAAPGRRRSADPGIVAGPAPGPFGSVAPATPEGTPNPAAPAYVQALQHFANRRFPVLRGLIGSPSWPVTSYTVVDQHGRPAVINVTHPNHPGSPGIVVRSDERLPSGRHRIRNEGIGLSRLQNPSLRSAYTGPLDLFTRYLWEAQSADNINRAHRNSRYVNSAHRNFRYGLPLE